MESRCCPLLLRENSSHTGGRSVHFHSERFVGIWVNEEWSTGEGSSKGVKCIIGCWRPSQSFRLILQMVGERTGDGAVVLDEFVG